MTSGSSAVVRWDEDWHVHSSFSDDAVSSIADNLAAAHARGLTTIRLSDHVRRDSDWVPRFLTALRAEPLPPGLRVLTGVEAKILDRSGALDIPDDLVFGPGGIDGVVIADHQFPGTDGPWHPEIVRTRLAEGLAPDEALEILISATVAAMRSVPAGTGQLAHPFSILPKVGLDEHDLSDGQLERWARTAAETGTLIEVNEKWACPAPRTLRAAAAAGARLVAASDAHHADQVGGYVAARDLVAAINEGTAPGAQP